MHGGSIRNAMSVMNTPLQGEAGRRQQGRKFTGDGEERKEIGCLGDSGLMANKTGARRAPLRAAGRDKMGGLRGDAALSSARRARRFTRDQP